MIKSLTGVHRSIDVWYQYFSKRPKNITKNAEWTKSGNIFADEVHFQGLKPNGAISVSESNVLINFCSFANCSSTAYGGCVSHTNGESIHLKICCLDCCTEDDGAYLYNSLYDEKDKRNFMYDCTICETEALSDSSFWLEHSKIDINAMNNSHNYADMNAFCVVQPGKENDANITFCRIYNNSSPSQAIFWSFGANFEIKKCQFVQNHQFSNQHGLIYYYSGTGEIRSSIFLYNKCYLIISDSDLKAYDCYLKNNIEEDDLSESFISTVKVLPFNFIKFIIKCGHMENLSIVCLYQYRSRIIFMLLLL